jgi:hypothetical protein
MHASHSQYIDRRYRTRFVGVSYVRRSLTAAWLRLPRPRASTPHQPFRRKIESLHLSANVLQLDTYTRVARKWTPGSCAEVGLSIHFTFFSSDMHQYASGSERRKGRNIHFSLLPRARGNRIPSRKLSLYCPDVPKKRWIGNI